MRAEIAGKGFARSQIVILDALLKLRQVGAADPRLLKSPAALRVKERAKLDLLMDMLPELIDEGRRILVFLQFTTMLGLIAVRTRQGEDRLGTHSTGDTRDRRIPVKDFQKGRAPVFLISLKAGPVWALNLTAAEYRDPLRPVVEPRLENQATDRAHRIGQDKPVFVFKLVRAGSIEEKILALGRRGRRARRERAVGGRERARQVLGEADIAALLAPLPIQPGAQREQGCKSRATALQDFAGAIRPEGVRSHVRSHVPWDTRDRDRTNCCCPALLNDGPSWSPADDDPRFTRSRTRGAKSGRGSRPSRSRASACAASAMKISTRRFIARPAAVVLSATGWREPRPSTAIRCAETPRCTR